MKKRYQQEKRLLDNLTESVNGYVNNYDPCPVCENKTETGYAEICHECAYFYAGQFKAKRNDHDKD